MFKGLTHHESRDSTSSRNDGTNRTMRSEEVSKPREYSTTHSSTYIHIVTWPKARLHMRVTLANYSLFPLGIWHTIPRGYSQKRAVIITFVWVIFISRRVPRMNIVNKPPWSPPLNSSQSICHYSWVMYNYVKMFYLHRSYSIKSIKSISNKYPHTHTIVSLIIST